MSENKNAWETQVTLVAPNNLVVRGYRLTDIVEKTGLIQAAHLVMTGEMPSAETTENLRELALSASQKPLPQVHRNPVEDVSKTFQKYLLCDEELVAFAPQSPVEKTVFALGRFAAYLAAVLGHESALSSLERKTDMGALVYAAITGRTHADAAKARLIEAVIVASMDHGVTPPSAQATLIAATVRASYEVSLAHGVGAITDIHGGAGEKAAEFFLSCVALSRSENLSLEEATRRKLVQAAEAKHRIKGMGHRVHTQDPRRDVLWNLAESLHLAGDCVAVSRAVSALFEEVNGKALPINVDGVIGALIADMGLDPKLAKALFIFGRVMGLSAHFQEEITTQSVMRRIDFTQAQYTGPMDKTL